MLLSMLHALCSCDNANVGKKFRIFVNYLVKSETARNLFRDVGDSAKPLLSVSVTALKKPSTTNSCTNLTFVAKTFLVVAMGALWKSLMQ
jgi:hypothetical protein